MDEVLAHDFDAKMRTKDVLLDQHINFQSLLLPQEIGKGLTAAGFKKPSPIQFKALPLGRCGFDLIVKSKSGTGKTLVFALIALETVKIERKCCQVLILVPAREIAVQICDVLRSTGRFIDGLVVDYFIGGLPLDDDIKKAKLCHVAVGAPGRVKHLISMGALATDCVRLFVLDEADKLMDETFQNDINDIFSKLPARKQLIAASATYTDDLKAFLANYMVSPTQVTSENETPLLLGLKQYYYPVSEPFFNTVQEMLAKNNLLLEILSNITFTQCLVFCNYQTRAQSVSSIITQKGFNSSYISAAESQIKRLEAVKNLQEFKSRILFSTDLTSRGIDAPNVDLVINYDLPYSAVEYLHRMGRAGRFGSEGKCINLTDEGNELKKLKCILGAIGGTNLSMPKLTFREDEEETSIFGIVLTDEEIQKAKEDIMNQVMEMKQKNLNKKGKKEKKSKNHKKKIELNVDTTYVKQVQTTKAEEIEEICQDFNEIGREPILRSNLENDEDSKKRKRASLEDEPKKPKNNKTRQNILIRNKARLNVTKLLSDITEIVSLELQNSIGEYLECLKDITTDGTENKTTEEILTRGNRSFTPNDDKGSPASENIEVVSSLAIKRSRTPDIEQEKNMENIFKIGYDALIQAVDWTSSLPAQEVQYFRSLCLDDQPISCDDEDDYVEDEEIYNESNETEDFAMGNDFQEVECRVNEAQDLNMQWTSEVHNEENSVDVELNEQYYLQCFNNCSSLLWQQGLRHGTLEDFDKWFLTWKQHLKVVRGYVEQNIYVSEMSMFQQSRLNN